MEKKEGGARLARARDRGRGRARVRAPGRRDRRRVRCEHDVRGRHPHDRRAGPDRRRRSRARRNGSTCPASFRGSRCSRGSSRGCERAARRPARSVRPDFDVYRALVEGIPAILYIDSLDEWSTNCYTSPQAERLLGYTAEEWGTDARAVVRADPPGRRERGRWTRTAVERDGGTVLVRVPDVIAKDGRTGVDPRRGRRRLDDEGERRVLARESCIDITAQKEAEEKLRWSLEVLRRTIQQRRELAQRLESAQEEERRRIAADIHDDPIQVMSAVDLRMRHDGGARRTGGPRPHRHPAGDGAAIDRTAPVAAVRTAAGGARPRGVGGGPHAVPASTRSKETGWTFEIVGSTRVRARSRAAGHALPHGAGGGGQRPEARGRLARGGHGDHATATASRSGSPTTAAGSTPAGWTSPGPGTWGCRPWWSAPS